MERGRIQGLPKFFEYPLLSQERVALRTSTFVRTFLVSIGNKKLSYRRETARQLPTWREGGARPSSPLPSAPYLPFVQFK